jgi:HK97 family phage prohead protease
MTQAQEARAAAAATKQIPADGARMLPFPALMRAEAVEWNGMGRYQLDGIASTTEQPYRMFDMFGEYDEVIDRAAFNETLSADPDVAFLVNHKGVTMARSRPNGRGYRSLELSVGATGLQSRAFLNPERQDVKDLVHAIRDNDITEMSFAFRIDDGEWDEDFTKFRIRKVDLNRGDVSAVNYGANPYTSIAARSTELLRDLDRLPVGAARAALERLQARRELQTTVVDLGALPIRKVADSEIRGEHGPKLTVPADAWCWVQPGAQIWARSGDDTPVLLGQVDDIEQDDAPRGPVRIRTAPPNGSGEAAPVLAPSPLLPPVQGIKNDERADLGRSLHLARLEWQMNSEWDDN